MKRFKIETAKKVQFESDSFWDALDKAHMLMKSGKYPIVKMSYLTASGYQLFSKECYRAGYRDQYVKKTR
jgi:hypothetical protein